MSIYIHADRASKFISFTILRCVGGSGKQLGLIANQKFLIRDCEFVLIRQIFLIQESYLIFFFIFFKKRLNIRNCLFMLGQVM